MPLGMPAARGPSLATSFGVDSPPIHMEPDVRGPVPSKRNWSYRTPPLSGFMLIGGSVKEIEKLFSSHLAKIWVEGTPQP